MIPSTNYINKIVSKISSVNKVTVLKLNISAYFFLDEAFSYCNFNYFISVFKGSQNSSPSIKNRLFENC